MQAVTVSPSGRAPMLQQLRRIGRVLTGDQKLADGILHDAFMRAENAMDTGGSIDRMDVVKLGFKAFEDAVHRKGRVVILKRACAWCGGSLGDRVSRLSYVERVAVALLLVESMTPCAGAALSGRPAQVLEEALATAMPKLDDPALLAG